MASPQKEDGYTPIANELLGAIYSAKFNSAQMKIVLLVLRYTYGFSRKECSLSLNFISQGIDVSRRYVSQELKTLIAANVITVIKRHTDTEARVLALNKNYETWSLGKRKRQQVIGCSTGDQLINTTGDQLINTTGDQLITQDKQTLKQTLKQVHGDLQKNNQAEVLFEELWQLYPRKRGKAAVSKEQKKRLLKLGMEQARRCIERFMADMNREARPPDKYPYGSTFFNSGYIDYLDENYLDEPHPDYGGPKHR